MEIESSLHLQQQIARLQALLDTTHRIHSTIELDSVLRSVLQITVRELEMAGAFFTAFPFSYGEIPPRFLLHPPSSDPKRGCYRFPLLDRHGAVLTEMVVITRDGAPLSSSSRTSWNILQSRPPSPSKTPAITNKPWIWSG
ncbi:hypothetical protein [Tunturiibacter gelidiferens]|uniref:hypothetical protein n=1 Tax=Tunturiibacter gelidiferens TaxID=3069689 RepID=UPI003D9BE589